jgi:hypothetical protein
MPAVESVAALIVTSWLDYCVVLARSQAASANAVSSLWSDPLAVTASAAE